MRFNIELPVSMTKEEVIRIVLADERARNGSEQQLLRNIIFVPNRIINIVIKN